MGDAVSFQGNKSAPSHAWAAGVLGNHVNCSASTRSGGKARNKVFGDSVCETLVAAMASGLGAGVKAEVLSQVKIGSESKNSFSNAVSLIPHVDPASLKLTDEDTQRIDEILEAVVILILKFMWEATVTMLGQVVLF